MFLIPAHLGIHCFPVKAQVIASRAHHERSDNDAITALIPVLNGSGLIQMACPPMKKCALQPKSLGDLGLRCGLVYFSGMWTRESSSDARSRCLSREAS